MNWFLFLAAVLLGGALTGFGMIAWIVIRDWLFFRDVDHTVRDYDAYMASVQDENQLIMDLQPAPSRLGIDPWTGGPCHDGVAIHLVDKLPSEDTQ